MLPRTSNWHYRCWTLITLQINIRLFFKLMLFLVFGDIFHTNSLSLAELWFHDKHKIFGFYFEWFCRYIALVDGRCMACKPCMPGHPHVPGNISCLKCFFEDALFQLIIYIHGRCTGMTWKTYIPGGISMFRGTYLVYYKFLLMCF